MAGGRNARTGPLSSRFFSRKEVEMRIGIIGGGPGKTLSDLAQDAARARQDGLTSYWLSRDTNVDLLTAVAVIGRVVPDLEFGLEIDLVIILRA